MPRTIALLPAFALSLCLCLGPIFCLPALADSYKLVNNSGVTLKVQSKAVQVTPPHGGKRAFYDLDAGQTKDVQFGDDHRLFMLHIYNKANAAQNFMYNATPAAIGGTSKAYDVVVKPGIQVDMTAR